MHIGPISNAGHYIHLYPKLPPTKLFMAETIKTLGEISEFTY
ncbi:Uncharacterised protein [Serratia quinivorans]|nr:Uncharacterised protein [Serratia quinivorans]